MSKERGLEKDPILWEQHLKILNIRLRTKATVNWVTASQIHVLVLTNIKILKTHFLNFVYLFVSNIPQK